MELGEVSGYTLKVLESLSQLQAAQWDALLGERGSPFLRHAFLYGLERCHCVGEESGCMQMQKTQGCMADSQD